MSYRPAPARTSSAVEVAPPAHRNRVVAFAVTVAVAAALLLAPQFSGSASAASIGFRSPAAAAKFAHSMLVQLNGERRAHHLKPLKMNSRLVLSAHRHNLTMARKNSMSHQLPGEAFFANRISRAGYKWQAAGENIGWNSVQTKRGLQMLERSMYNEKAPDNGHRLNILSRSFRQVGIDVYFDRAHNKMWFTQDFGQPA